MSFQTHAPPQSQQPIASPTRKSFNLHQMEQELENYQNMLRQGNLEHFANYENGQQMQPQTHFQTQNHDISQYSETHSQNSSAYGAMPQQHNSYASMHQRQQYAATPQQYASQPRYAPGDTSSVYSASEASYVSQASYYSQQQAPYQAPQHYSSHQSYQGAPGDYSMQQQPRYQQAPHHAAQHQSYQAAPGDYSMQHQQQYTQQSASRRPGSAPPVRPTTEALSDLEHQRSKRPGTARATAQPNNTSDTVQSASEIDLSNDTDASAQPYQPKNRHKVEHVRKRLQNQLQQECTFKPQINKRFRSTKTRTTGKGRLELLSQPKDLSNLENKRKELEQDELKECTFKPNIVAKKDAGNNKSTRSASTSVNSSNPQELVDRLTYSHDDRLAQREMQKRMQELELVQKYKFRPQIRKESKKLIDESNYRPVHERVGELQRQKHEMLQSLRLKTEQEKQEEYTFAPQVSERSEEIAKSKLGNVSFHDRFVHPESVYNNERHRSRHSEFEEKENYSFKPKVNRNSKKILEGRALYGKHTDFLKRQEILTIQQQQQQHQLKKQLSQQHQFKPNVSKTSRFLMETKPELATETPEDRIERLAYRDKQRMEALREMIHEKHYGQFDFKPQINPLSRAMARPTDIVEMANVEHNRRVKELAKNRLLKEENKQCTFQPQLMNPELTAKLAENSKFRNTEEMMQEKERRIEEFRRMEQYREIKNCTFQPQINKSPRRNSGPVLVNGLGRHLQRAERAKQQKDEQERREQEAFKVKVQDYQRQLPYTIPEPFNLRHDPLSSEEHRRKTRQKWQKHEMANCTFKPQTNTSLEDFVMEGL